MEGIELLDCLVGLAEQAGLPVRVLAAVDPDLPARSGVCRVRDRHLVLLVPGDALEDRIDVVAGALAVHRPRLLEERFLPPAVRERIEALRDRA
jgi:hypothetical protein